MSAELVIGSLYSINIYWATHFIIIFICYLETILFCFLLMQHTSTISAKIYVHSVNIKIEL